jgi:hypothetical protein
VDHATPRTIARDVHRFAQEKPAWFFGGAFLLGLAVGRFVKSSSERHHDDDDGLRFTAGEQGGYAPPGYPQAKGAARATYAQSSPYPASTQRGVHYADNAQTAPRYGNTPTSTPGYGNAQTGQPSSSTTFGNPSGGSSGAGKS